MDQMLATSYWAISGGGISPFPFNFEACELVGCCTIVVHLPNPPTDFLQGSVLGDAIPFSRKGTGKY